MENNHQKELEIIEELFHKVIRKRAGGLLDKPHNKDLNLPIISMDLLSCNRNWFPVPGMYGGFSYQLFLEDNKLKLISSSWSRIVGGSGQRHEITKDGLLVKEGFV